MRLDMMHQILVSSTELSVLFIYMYINFMHRFASLTGAILSSNKVNNDFASSKDELSALHVKFNSLVLQHKALIE